jgi:hypothetical protein
MQAKRRRKMPSTARIFVVLITAAAGLALAAGMIKTLAATTGWGTWTWTLYDPGEDQLVINSNETLGSFGQAIAPGDFNGDGAIDLAISAPTISRTASVQGEVYIIPGKFRLGEELDAEASAAITFRGLAESEQLGTLLDSGDLNGDGYDDLIMEAFYSEEISQTYVYLGSPEITSTLPHTISATWDNMALTIYQSIAGLALCNINGDAYKDLFLETYSFTGDSNALNIWGILGNSELSASTPITIADISEAADIHIQGVQVDSWSAPNRGNIGCGDIDGDGYNDLAFGTSRDSPDGRYGAGRVYLIRGGAQFTSAAQTSVQLPDQAGAIINGIDGGDGNGAYGDMLGSPLTVADLNQDGFADLLVSAHNADGPDYTVPEAGEVYLWLGRPLNGQNVEIASEAAWTLYSEQPEGALAASLDTGDFDGDGQPEIILGCPSCERLYIDRGRRVYIVEANQAPGMHIVSEVAAMKIIPTGDLYDFGRVVKSINLDADAYDDLVFGVANRGIGFEPLPGKVLAMPYPIRYRVFLPLAQY